MRDCPTLDSDCPKQVKHYPETLARAEPEADDAGYDLNPPLKQPSDQVLAEADAETLRNLNEARATDQQNALPHNI